MDWITWTQVLGNLGEFFGALGVIVTLFYLARQIRFSSRAQTTATQHQILSEFRKGQDLLLDHPDLLEALATLALEQDVPEASRRKLQYYIGNQFRTYEELFLAYRKGSVDEEFWQARKAVLKNVFLRRGFVQSWWESGGKMWGFSNPFVELVGDLTNELGS